MNIRNVIIGLVPVLIIVGAIALFTGTDRDAPKAVAMLEPAAVPAETAPSAVVTDAPAAAPAAPVPAPAEPLAAAPEAAAPPTANMPKSINTPPAVAPADATSAVVNGVQISPDQVEEELERLLIEPSIHGGMNADRRNELRAKALDELVVRELAFQDATAKGIVATPREKRSAVDKIRQKYHSTQGFSEALAAEGITEEQLGERLGRDVTLAKYYRAEVDTKARVTERDVRRYYEDHLGRFVMPESLHLVAIFVSIDPKDEATAKKKIDEAYADLQKGVPFDAVAYKFSEDDYAVMGGDYATVHRGQLSAEFENLVFGAKENELVGPGRTSIGWQIFRVDNRRAERQLPYAEVRDKLRKSLASSRLSECRARLIADLRAAASIEYATASPESGATGPAEGR